MKEMPQKKGYERLILPQGLGFDHSLCPGVGGGGNAPIQKKFHGFLPQGDDHAWN